MEGPSRKSDHYYSPRRDLIRHVPHRAKHILDVGCGPGETATALRERGGLDIVGVEVDEEVAARGKDLYDALLVGDVEKMELPFEDGHFDCILYGDVLEHLVDPWSLLKRHRRLLSDDGVIICSIPNIQHYRILKRLAFRGRWEYVESGILDRGHLRFFTWTSIIAMLEEAGFTPLTTVKRPSGASWLKLLNKALGGRLISYLVRQYIVVAGKGTRNGPG
jgi:SAM-dependent methyltransferase